MQFILNYILLQDDQTGERVFYMKGADVVMCPIVSYNDWLEEEVDNMAREGLRTLVVAKKALTPEQYSDFEQGRGQLSRLSSQFASQSSILRCSKWVSN